MTSNKSPLPPLALLLDSGRGIYIPENFVNGFDMTKWEGISDEDKATLSGDKDSVHYWDAWCDVLNNATFTFEGNVWRLYQDGDLWAYCLELMTDEDKKNFGFTED